MFAFPSHRPFLTSSAVLNRDLEKLSVNLPKTLRPNKAGKRSWGLGAGGGGESSGNCLRN